MREHNKQDTLIMTVITTAAVFLILTLFGNSQAAVIPVPGNYVIPEISSYQYALDAPSGSIAAVLSVLANII